MREKRPGSRELLGLVGNAIRVAQPSLSPLPSRLLAFYGPLDPFEFCRQPTFLNPLCWLNVGHQMIPDQHDRALKVIFSRIRENKEILGNLKIEGTQRGKTCLKAKTPQA